MRRTPAVQTALFLLMTLLAGCGPAGRGKGPLGEGGEAAEGREFLTVDFEQGRTLRYKFVSSRDITIGWDAPQTTRRPGRGADDKSSESMEVVVLYRATEVDPYGLSTVEATCESVRVRRSKGSPRDAVVGPTGKIEDYSQLDDLLKEIGERAFRTDAKRGRIKEPDMIGDFVASQWFLWDAISSIERPSEGVTAGQSWKSKLSVPTPMVIVLTLARFTP